jgi:acyl-CoA synthetase (AMP-forming)/AMP-acid ligase II
MLALEMAASGFAARTAVTDGTTSLTFGELAAASRAAAHTFDALRATAVVYVGTNHIAYPVCVFGAAAAGIPLVPLNYRLGEEQLRALVAAHPGSVIVSEGRVDLGSPELERNELVAQLRGRAVERELPDDSSSVAIVLYTSGTTAAPKAALLRHRHLMSYVVGSVEFGAAAPDDAALVTVPPYHVAGLANVVSNVYAGRRIVYLDAFAPDAWLETVRRERITQAMVVPTMLTRIVAYLDGAADAGTPTLRSLSYGGSPIAPSVLARALELFPETGFVNAYGLTETSSTIALLTAEDHRAALASDDADSRTRLSSVGRLLPGIELEVRDELGNTLPPGSPGLLWLRGEQISGEYADGSLLDDDGWFSTRDRAWVDADGYIFLEGRADDTIIRAGENIAPAEIEAVLVDHPQVEEAVVVGLPDDEWGQRLVAVVVATEEANVTAAELKEMVRRRLRSSKTPDDIRFQTELPRTETGKVMRRKVVEQLSG